MPKFHHVKTGDCFASASLKYGFDDYHTLYDNGQNAQLKGRRPNANMLVPGDIITIPDKTDKDESRPTSARHEFTVGGLSVFFSAIIEDETGSPYASKKYDMTVNGDIRSGTLTAAGLLEQPIPADLTDTQITIHTSDTDPSVVMQWAVTLGTLEPVDTTKGVQARLNNLGYACGTVDGITGGRTEAALRRFQVKKGLSPTGHVDDNTKTQLRQEHDGA